MDLLHTLKHKLYWFVMCSPCTTFYAIHVLRLPAGLVFMFQYSDFFWTFSVKQPMIRTRRIMILTSLLMPAECKRRTAGWVYQRGMKSGYKLNIVNESFMFVQNNRHWIYDYLHVQIHIYQLLWKYDYLWIDNKYQQWLLH